jgi:hypothetical protein
MGFQNGRMDIWQNATRMASPIKPVFGMEKSVFGMKKSVFGMEHFFWMSEWVPRMAEWGFLKNRKFVPSGLLAATRLHLASPFRDKNGLVGSGTD